MGVMLKWLGGARGRGSELGCADERAVFEGYRLEPIGEGFYPAREAWKGMDGSSI
jgi:hypothetical protein